MITCWGDSLTAAGGLPERLAELAGVPVANAGVGGENALLIAARCNALPFVLEIVEPTSMGFEVRVASSHWSGVAVHPLVQGSGVPDESEPQGSVAGVHGRLRWLNRDATEGPGLAAPGDRYEFVPDPGPREPWPRPATFRYDFAEGHRSDIAVLWLGQNGPDDPTTLDCVEAFAQWARNEFLVMTHVGVDATGWTPLEMALQRRWGHRFANVRRFLLEDALTWLGRPPTPEDAFDQSIGRVPRSLRTDHVHHTPEAQRVIAEHLVWPRLQEFWPREMS